MQAEQSILDRIQRSQLKWYGHLLRMEYSRWPKKIYQWTPYGRRRRGRPQQSWTNQVTDFMRSRNMEKDMAEDGYLWRWEWMDDSLAVQILILSYPILSYLNLSYLLTIILLIREAKTLDPFL